MKKLVLYYSMTGNTAFVANEIAKAIKADIFELKTKKKMKKKGFMKFFHAGKQVIFKIKPKLNETNIDISKYDIIFVGSPVWVGTYVPALNSFFSKNKIVNKKLALFATYRSGSGNIFENLASLLEGNEIIDKIGFQEPKSKIPENNKEISTAISNWVKKIIDNI